MPSKHTIVRRDFRVDRARTSLFALKVPYELHARARQKLFVSPVAVRPGAPSLFPGAGRTVHTRCTRTRCFLFAPPSRHIITIIVITIIVITIIIIVIVIILVSPRRRNALARRQSRNSRPVCFACAYAPATKLGGPAGRSPVFTRPLIPRLTRPGNYGNLFGFVYVNNVRFRDLFVNNTARRVAFKKKKIFLYLKSSSNLREYFVFLTGQSVARQFD